MKPPDDLRSWSKNALVREVRRLRAVMQEHAERVGSDPREQATTGDAVVDVVGDPNALHGAILDARAAVLMESIDVSLIDVAPHERGHVACFLALGGRVNYSTDSVQHAYMFGPEGAAALATELIGIAGRSGAHEHTVGFGERFTREFAERMEKLP